MARIIDYVKEKDKQRFAYLSLTRKEKEKMTTLIKTKSFPRSKYKAAAQEQNMLLVCQQWLTRKIEESTQTSRTNHAKQMAKVCRGRK
jgi:hypothetical protein